MPRFRTLIFVSAAVSLFVAAAPASAQDVAFPMRDGARPETTSGVPHVQIGIQPVPGTVGRNAASGRRLSRSRSWGDPRITPRCRRVSTDERRVDRTTAGHRWRARVCASSP